MDVNPYQSPVAPPGPDGSPPPGRPRPSSFGGYGEAIVVALVQQGIVLLLAALMLDFGYTLRLCTVAAAAAWSCVLVVMLLRPTAPTTLYLIIVKYSFWPALVATFAVVVLVRTWAGYGL
jgi:hypothetical protein